jgi:hypothetical protein
MCLCGRHPLRQFLPELMSSSLIRLFRFETNARSCLAQKQEYPVGICGILTAGRANRALSPMHGRIFTIC